MAQWLGFSSGPTSGSIEHSEQHWHHKWWPHQPNCRSGPPYRTSGLNAKTLKINSDCKGLNENFHTRVQSHSNYRIVFEHMRAFSKQSLNNIIIIAQQSLWKNSTHIFVSYLVKLFRNNQTIILIKRIKTPKSEGNDNPNPSTNFDPSTKNGSLLNRCSHNCGSTEVTQNSKNFKDQQFV